MQLIREGGYSFKPHLLLNAPGKVLQGRDIVGVSCRYDDDHSWVGRYCVLENSPAIPCGTNATCMLVASGIVASAVLLAGEGPPKVGVHLTHELPGWLPVFRSFVEVHEYDMPSLEA
jgi:homospermidine synthase